MFLKSWFFVAAFLALVGGSETVDCLCGISQRADAPPYVWLRDSLDEMPVIFSGTVLEKRATAPPIQGVATPQEVVVSVSSTWRGVESDVVTVQYPDGVDCYSLTPGMGYVFGLQRGPDDQLVGRYCDTGLSPERPEDLDAIQALPEPRRLPESSFLRANYLPVGDPLPTTGQPVRVFFSEAERTRGPFAGVHIVGVEIGDRSFSLPDRGSIHFIVPQGSYLINVRWSNGLKRIVPVTLRCAASAEEIELTPYCVAEWISLSGQLGLAAADL